MGLVDGLEALCVYNLGDNGTNISPPERLRYPCLETQLFLNFNGLL